MNVFQMLDPAAGRFMSEHTEVFIQPDVKLLSKIPELTSLVIHILPLSQFANW